MRWTRTSLLGIALFTLNLPGCGETCSKGFVSSAPIYATPLLKRQGTTASLGAKDSVRVMSFNVRQKLMTDLGNGWAFRRNLMVKTVRRFNPDILCTQECEVGQANDIQETLYDYDFVGAGRDNGKSSGEMCGVFFKTKTFRKLDEGHFWLSKNPGDPGSKSWGAMFTRMVTWVKLRHHLTGRDLYVFNTHFDQASDKARRESARLLERKIAQIALNTPVIVTGDFNTGESSKTYNILADHKGYVLLDTFRQYDRTPSVAERTHHGFNGKTRGERIDWIMVSPEFTTLFAGIDRTHDGGRYPSDHFPVTAVVRLQGRYAAQPSDTTSTASVPAGRRGG